MGLICNVTLAKRLILATKRILNLLHQVGPSSMMNPCRWPQNCSGLSLFWFSSFQCCLIGTPYGPFSMLLPIKYYMCLMLCPRIVLLLSLIVYFMLVGFLNQNSGGIISLREGLASNCHIWWLSRSRERGKMKISIVGKGIWIVYFWVLILTEFYHLCDCEAPSWVCKRLKLAVGVKSVHLSFFI